MTDWRPTGDPHYFPVVLPEIATTIEIDGIRYAREIFQFFGREAKAGQCFRFLNRDDGVVTLGPPPDLGGELTYKLVERARHVDTLEHGGANCEVRLHSAILELREALVPFASWRRREVNWQRRDDALPDPEASK